MKGLIYFFICITAIFSFAGCVNNDSENQPYQTTEHISTSAVSESYQSPTQAIQAAPVTQHAQSSVYQTIQESLSETAKPLIPDTVLSPSSVPSTEEPSQPSTTKPLEKTGEMAFSDDAGNRYISAISSKYSVDSKTLVALYTVPENDSNIVLQFDGSKNSDGSLIRNKSTLIAIYSIDKNLNSKRASEDKSLNEYSYGEMKVMFISTTTYIMPEFEQLK